KNRDRVQDGENQNERGCSHAREAFDREDSGANQRARDGARQASSPLVLGKTLSHDPARLRFENPKGPSPPGSPGSSSVSVEKCVSREACAFGGDVGQAGNIEGWRPFAWVRL